jgi:antitoxin YobK
MTLEELRRLDASYRQKKPRFFELSTPDPPASEQQLEAVERALGVQLPQRYRQFLCEFGGGTFGLATIFSADPDSEWYLPRQQSEASRYLPEGLVAFSDDFAGGNYAFRIANGRAQEPVVYWNQDGGEMATEFSDVIEFVARYAYEPA